MNYGLLSLLPPVVAVILAIWSKNVILSLFCGGFVGAMIFCGGNPFAAVHSMIGDYFFIQLTDSYNTATELVKKRKDAYKTAEDMLMVLDEDNELSPERVEEIIADMQAQDIWNEYIGVTMFVLRQGI